MLQTVHDHAVSLGASCGAQESARAPMAADRIRLVESVDIDSAVQLQESAKTKPIRLIQPGKGATAYYTPEVLKRDGPKIFHEGVPMRIDHPTKSQTSERPEGSVRDWGGVLEADAYWLDAGQHPKAPGLFGSIKPFASDSQTIEEKGKYAGVSISAYGTVVTENGKPGGRPVMREGVPLLASLDFADGVDMVTRAGAGGMFLQESHREGLAGVPAGPIATQEASMAETADYTKLQEAVTAQEATNKRLLERAIRGDARDAGARLLEGVSLPAAAKLRVIEAVVARGVPTKDGELDATKFAEAIATESQDMGRFLSQLDPHRVTGMGGAAAPVQTAEEVTRTREADVRLHKDAIKIFEGLGMPKDAAAFAASNYGEDTV